jgi:hypothetical protein
MAIDYRNYARSIELMKFETINESATQNPQDNVSKLFAGKNTSAYAWYWDQVYKQIMTAVDNGYYSGTATVKQAKNDAEFCNIFWSVDQNTGVCKYSRGQSSPQVTQSATPAPQTPPAPKQEQPPVGWWNQ